MTSKEFDIAIGRFGVDIAAFEQIGLMALEKATRLARDQVGMVIIDEIARMELTSPGFAQATEAMFAGPLAVVVTLHVHEHPVTDALKRRHDIEVVNVTETNRDSLPARLFHQLTGSATQGGSG